MNTTKIRIAVVATIAALVITLAGCTTEAPETDPTTSPRATETAETQAPAEAAAPKTGDILTVAPTDLGPSQRAFPLPDGTFVMLDRYEPLPAGVQDILNTQATTAIPYDPNAVPSEATFNQPADDATAFRSATVVATGKNVIVVYRRQGVGGCNGSGPDPWTYTGAAGTCVAFPSAAAAQAAAEANVAGRQDADTYIVVVKQG